jgi:hypothetical protein
VAVPVQLAPEVGQLQVHAAQGLIGVVNGFTGNSHGAGAVGRDFPGPEGLKTVSIHLESG